ncbi:MAG: family N-acetyltransferase [Homoserinimonas sp.]|nr:family N-acetyltransferase [Homoserinimonas sp.]
MVAMARGFHEQRPSPDELDEQLRGNAHRRTTGVWDAAAADPATPVATVSSWPTDMTVPGDSTVAAWAISAVTVSPTHRRRGIARALLESELRTAHTLAIPVAVLTVSEATIYSRYGFAPAAMSADLRIATPRAKWAGPVASGQLHLVSPEQLLDDGRELVKRVQLRAPGQLQLEERLWQRILCLIGDRERAKNTRVVRYDDGGGRPQGFAVYRVVDTGPGNSQQVLDLHYLVAATDDAYAGLWQYLIEMDLVGSVTASLRPVDEPLAWMLSDFRAVVKTNERDHLWVRILDVKTALEGRRYSSPGRVVLEVQDALNFTDGRYLLDIDGEGHGVVSLTAEPADISLTVNELGALYLGGTTLATLRQAGRIAERTPGAVATLDASFRSAVAPWLSFWF